MACMLLLVGLMLISLSTFGQRPKVTKATVFLDDEGKVISKAEYRQKRASNLYDLDDAQAKDGVYTSIGLKKMGAPDKERLQAESPLRAFRTPAPSFSLTDLNGQPVSTTALLGKVVVVNFWYIKCGFCVLEMPALKQLTATYKDNPNVVFLSFAPDSPDLLRKFLAKQGDFGFAVLPLSKELEAKFGVLAYPTTAVIDKRGLYTFDKVGYASNLSRLDEAIQRALR